MIKFSFDDEINDSYYNQTQNGELDIFGVFANLVVQLILGHNGVQVPSQDSQYTLLATGTNGGEENDFAIVHACQTGRDGDEMADDGDKTSSKRCSNAVIVKIFLAFFNFLLIKQAHLTPFAIGQLVDDRTTNIQGYKVVDAGTNIGTKCGKKYY